MHVFSDVERHAIRCALADRLNDLEIIRSTIATQINTNQADDLISATKSALEGIMNADSLVAKK